MRGILTEKVSKSKLRGIIELSMEKEKDYEKNESKWRLSKKWRAKCCVEGSKKLIMREDGLVWMLPQ